MLLWYRRHCRWLRSWYQNPLHFLLIILTANLPQKVITTQTPNKTHTRQRLFMRMLTRIAHIGGAGIPFLLVE